MSTLVDWSHIDTVLLDMDGTLLDLHFDNFFWQKHLPRRYREIHGERALDDASLRALFHAHVGTLPWYSVDFWAEELSLDIMQLKEEVAHLIAVHPHVESFLAKIRQTGRRVILATNAHYKALTLKLAKTGLETHFDAVVSSHALGAAKEEQLFWQRLREIEAFDPARTLLVDDSLPVLDSAKRFGIAHLVAVKRPDTQAAHKDTGAYPAIDDFSQLLP
jgi:HAD superfamily hydrolase (TIGR01509 family)